MSADDLHRLADVTTHSILAGSAVGTVMWWLWIGAVLDAVVDAV